MGNKFKYYLVSIGSMNSQINVRLNPKLLSTAESYAKKNGYSSLQDLIKASLREKVFDEKSLSDEEAMLVSKLIEVSEKKDLYGAEEDLFKKLRG